MTPYRVLADDTTEPSVRLTVDQFQALVRMCEKFDGVIGLLDAGHGYVKVTFHDHDGNTLGRRLLYADYGADVRTVEPFVPEEA